MIPFLFSQIRRRPGRALALGTGVLVSSVAFVLLTGSARSGEVKAKGSVQSNFRSAYDVLVRPKGSTTKLERTQGLVRDNYLSGIFGGITLKQWRQIERLPGVAVAAPIANVGYTAALANVRTPLTSYLTDAPVQLFRLQSSYVTSDGSRYPAGTMYVYVTRTGIFVDDNAAIAAGRVGQVDHGRLVNPCAGITPPATFKGPFEAGLFPSIACYSTRSGRVEQLGQAMSSQASGAGVEVGGEATGWFPVLLTAIDPSQEARLLHLDRSVVSGRYLRSGEVPVIQTRSSPYTHNTTGNRYVPVLAAANTFVGDRVETKVDRLAVPSGVDVPKTLATGTCLVARFPCPAGSVVRPPKGSAYSSALGFLRGLRAVPVGRQQTGFDSIYHQLLSGFADQKNTLSPNEYWTVSGVHYQSEAHGTLVPTEVFNPPSVYSTNFTAGSTSFETLPADNEDAQFRQLSERTGDNEFDSHGILNTPFLRVVGQFDASKLPGFSPLSKVPLETYYPPLLTAADAPSRKALRGQPLAPTQNLGDYIQQPPLFLTTISSLPAFFNSQFFHGVPPAERHAPISAIRVRVAGVSGANAASVARIDSVALRIHELTGLQVDITAGSSPHPLTVRLPAGKFGRPKLELVEGWSKKGVSLLFLRGVDRKQLALFALIPLICCLFLGNGTFAAARARRSEIGTLLTLGWTRAAIFRLLLGEILLVALAAGAVGVGAAAALTLLLGLQGSLWTVVLVLPSALALALLAGFVPALRASSGQPLDALRPPVSQPRSGGNVHRLAGMALVNLRRVPGRAALGALGLAVGACALTVLIAVEQAFNGVLAGTVLGDAISVQIRGFDYLAVGLVIGLAALSIADVLYLNLRERQAELVTLRTLGWQQRHLAQVVLAEALVLGLVAATIGAVAGVVIGLAVLHAPVAPVVEGAGAALVGAVLAASVASLLPLSQIGRLTPPSVLAAEQ